VAWELYGATLEGVAGVQLAPRWFRRGQQVACVVGAQRSAAMTIANTPPEADGVVLAVDPDAPREVVATPVGYFDVDGDPQSWRLRWTVDGAPTEAGERLKLPEERPAAGRWLVAVEAVPSDGTADGETVRSTLTVAYDE